MSMLTHILFRLFIATWLTLGLLAPAMAEPRGVLIPRMDALTQSRMPSRDSEGKTAADTNKQEIKTAQKPSKNCCPSTSKPCTGKCTTQCTGTPAKAGYFSGLFDLFDGHPGCPRGDVADSFDDSTLPTPDRPPRLI